MKRLSLAGSALAIGFLAYAPAHAGSINGMQQSAVCDPTTNQGLNCLKPNTDGSLNIAGGGVAQGSTTSGQSGTLVQGAVTTAAPTYTNATTNPLSLDQGGGLRAVIQDTNHVPVDWTLPVPVIITPSATVGVLTQSCTVACASTIISGAHGVYGLSFSATATGWLLIYDAVSCPANGTVTPKKAIAYTVANVTQGASWSDTPMIDATGIAGCFSTTGPYTATASTTAFISIDYK